jgi:hypothetical protein
MEERDMNTRTDAPIYDAPEVERLLKTRFAEQQFPNPPPALDGYVIFWDPGLSILRLRTFRGGTSIFYPQTWYDNEPFAKLDEPPCYRQLRMEAVPKLFDKTFAEQQAIVPPGEEIPMARVVVMAIVIHFLVASGRLFQDYYVRCIDQTSNGNRVSVGGFGSDGFGVSDCWDDSRLDSLGLASCRKF